MAYVITQTCVGTCDTACVDVCPSDCIHGPIALEEIRSLPADARGARLPGLQLFIDPTECIDCHACLPECPVGAIFHESEVPAEHRRDVARNAEFFER